MFIISNWVCSGPDEAVMGRRPSVWGRGDRGLDGAPGWRQARSPLTLPVCRSFPPLCLPSPPLLLLSGAQWILLHLQPGQRLLLGINKSWGFSVESAERGRYLEGGPAGAGGAPTHPVLQDSLACRHRPHVGPQGPEGCCPPGRQLAGVCVGGSRQLQAAQS